MADPTPSGDKKPWHGHQMMLVIGIVFAAVLGFVYGSRPSGSTPTRADAPDSGVAGDFAPTYATIARSDQKESSVALEIRALQEAARNAPGNTAAVGSKLAMRADMVAERAERRAYNGAPPVIPHPAAAQGGELCMTCHRTGFRVGDVAVPEMSHPYFSQCTQCHAPSVEVLPRTMPRLPDTMDSNEFVGLVSALEGTRAWPGAPPTVPHTIEMRVQCTSCHAPMGREGLATSHPWRSQCRQCHVPSINTQQLPPTSPGLAPVGILAPAPPTVVPGTARSFEATEFRYE